MSSLRQAQGKLYEESGLRTSEYFYSRPRCFASFYISLGPVLERSEGMTQWFVILRRSRRIWPAKVITFTMEIMSASNQYYVYIMTNKSGTLYVGLTNNIKKRVHEHKNKLISGFTKKYNISRLLYFETFSDAYSAIAREKTIKGWLRKKKIELVNEANPEWADLSQDWYD